MSPRVFVFGHIGAGNLHVNVLGPDPADDTVDEAVMRLAAAHGGTISAEHGSAGRRRRWTRPACSIPACCCDERGHSELARIGLLGSAP